MSSNKKVSNLIIKLTGVLTLAMGLFHLYCGFFGQPEAFLFRSTFVTYVLILCFLFYPLGGKFWKGKFDLLFVINSLFVFLPILFYIYVVHDIEAWYFKYLALTNFDVVIQTILIVLVLEATRRTLGWPMTIIAIFFLINARFANYMPLKLFYGPSTTWKSLVGYIGMQEVGIFGAPVRVIASIITLFMIFSSFLEESKFIDIFLKLAYAISGAQVGGPAKAAVVASASMGTISGSSVANVAVTGSFTIPLMKRLGYSPTFAGAVEAIASTGGQIAPPVMGAAAFIIAEFLGVRYLQVVIWAIIPAILYFFTIFTSIHLESTKKGIIGIPRSKLPSISKTLKEGGHLLIPLAVLFCFLIKGYSMQRAIMWTITVTFFLAMLKKETRLTPESFLNALKNGIKKVVPVGVACACAGIIIGSILISGTGWRISNLILNLAEGKFWLATIYSMIICIILGMGISTTAVYLVAATLVIPTLIKLGMIPPAAHFFAFYFGVYSNITPPVCLASFTAASISGAGINQTGFEAIRIGASIFLIPFLFLRYPELLLITEGTTWFMILITFTFSCFAIISLQSGIAGFLFRRLNFYERILMFIFPVFLFVQDIRNPIPMCIYLIMSALIIYLLKVFPYNKNLDSWFFRFSKLLQVKQNSDKKLFGIQEMKKRVEQMDKLDFRDLSISKNKDNKNWLGWFVLGCLFFILSILAKIHYPANHFVSFILILLFLAFLADTIIGFQNRKSKE